MEEVQTILRGFCPVEHSQGRWRFKHSSVWGHKQPITLWLGSATFVSSFKESQSLLTKQWTWRLFIYLSWLVCHHQHVHLHSSFRKIQCRHRTGSVARKLFCLSTVRQLAFEIWSPSFFSLCCPVWRTKAALQLERIINRLRTAWVMGKRSTAVLPWCRPRFA